CDMYFTSNTRLSGFGEIRVTVFGFVSIFFFFSSRRRHTRSLRDWSSDVCSSDLDVHAQVEGRDVRQPGLAAVGHRLPVLAPEEVRTHVPRPFVQPWPLLRVLDRTAGALVDALGPVDLHERLGRDQLAGLAIEHVEE